MTCAAKYVLWYSVTLVLAALRTHAASIEFDRDIRPILSDNCYQCHGPDEKARKAKLRLDMKESAFRVEDGVAVISPGQSAESELFRRITTNDPDDHMPPPESNHKLTPKQIALIKQWIDSGAKWSGHWAFNPIQSPKPPVVKNARWPANEIDHFILARLEQEKLSPSPEADRERLIRRITFDLTGLPPTLAEVDAFLADKSPGAYEKVVDRLLQSPRYGERMATAWLDLARYADTYGYQMDAPRPMWPYRDWVIKAFNQNLPFDQFVTWQLPATCCPMRQKNNASPPHSIGFTCKTKKAGSSMRNFASPTLTIASTHSALLFSVSLSNAPIVTTTNSTRLR